MPEAHSERHSRREHDIRVIQSVWCVTGCRCAVPDHASQAGMTEPITQDQWCASCACAYLRLDDNGKSPWHFISTHVAFTAIVSRIIVSSAWFFGDGNPECPSVAQIDVTRTRLTIACIVEPSTHCIERLGRERPIPVSATLPDEMKVRILKFGVPVPCAMHQLSCDSFTRLRLQPGVLAALPAWPLS